MSETFFSLLSWTTDSLAVARVGILTRKGGEEGGGGRERTPIAAPPLAAAGDGAGGGEEPAGHPLGRAVNTKIW
jgi:hypothetical protein